MTRARDIAFIRKLCALDVPAQALVQSLLPALRLLIPSHSAGVFWVDAQGDMASLFAERLLPPDAMARYYERHYDKARDGFAEAFRIRAHAEDPVSSRSFTGAEQQTDYFRDVMHALDAYHVLYGILKRNDNRPFAQISFYRGRLDRPFERCDRDTLRELLRYIAAALSRSAAVNDPEDSTVTVEEQLGIVRSDGAIVSAPDSWHRLVRLAALPQVSPRDAAKQTAAVADFLRCVCEFARRNPGAARWDVDRESAWGAFSIRAFRLPDANGRRADQIGVLIRREEARAVSLVRGAGVSELSPQQREVAVLLAQGKSNREIAEQLGLTVNTASFHVKQVYARLDVNQRHAVENKLLGLAQVAVASN